MDWIGHSIVGGIVWTAVWYTGSEMALSIRTMTLCRICS